MLMSTRPISSFRSMRAASSFTSSALTRRSTTRSVTCWAIASTGFRLSAGRGLSRVFTYVSIPPPQLGLLGFWGQLGVLLAVEQPVQPGREHPSDQRGHNEQPYLRERGTADDEGRAEAAGRIHRRAGYRDADQVDHGQRQPDG